MQVERAKKSLERHWGSQSYRSWLTVLHQIVKIFVLSRVTPKQYKGLPGVIEGRNVFEVPLTGRFIPLPATCLWSA